MLHSPLKKHLLVASIIISFLISSSFDFWGFYGHRLINNTAVFTLPVELLPLYKSNIDYVTEHSIDPDKRRYASPLEAIRHYIDIDHCGEWPFEEVPRKLSDAVYRYSSLHILRKDNRDTLKTWKGSFNWEKLLTSTQCKRIKLELGQQLISIQENGFIQLPVNYIPEEYKSPGVELILTEYFTEQGILPYHLVSYQNRLTNAFKKQDWALVLRISAELGHYIADANVPLHTTVNYNGQLTGQDGIHAFWESRIPELFAEGNYNLFVDRAELIEDIPAWFWNMVLESHKLVDKVLEEERRLSQEFDRDKQYCYEQRGTSTSRLACKEFAAAYQEALNGMVETQMRKAIQAVGSAWYTAWVNAGSPVIEGAPTGISWETDAVENLDSLLIKNRDRIHELNDEY